MNNITTTGIVSSGNLLIAGTTTNTGQSTLQQLSATNITANNLTINSRLTTLQKLCYGNLTVSGSSYQKRPRSGTNNFNITQTYYKLNDKINSSMA